MLIERISQNGTPRKYRDTVALSLFVLLTVECSTRANRSLCVFHIAITG